MSLCYRDQHDNFKENKKAPALRVESTRISAFLERSQLILDESGSIRIAGPADPLDGGWWTGMR